MSKSNLVFVTVVASCMLSASADAQRTQDKAAKMSTPKTTMAANVLVPFGPITKIDNQKATATKQARTVTFRFSTGTDLEAVKQGQPILLSVDGKTAAYVKFPLKVPFAKNCVGKGPGNGCFRMETRDARVSNTGLITGKTHTISEDVIEGFTGQVWVQLLDRDGNPLVIKRAGCYGVNMRQGRDDVWSIQVPADQAVKAARAEVWHAHSGCGRDRWDEVLEKAKKVAEVVGELRKTASSDSTSTPTQPKR